MAFLLFQSSAFSQCPGFTNVVISGNETTMCEGESVTISMSGQNILPGSTVDFYLGTGTFNPYNGEGDFIGSISTLTFPDFIWSIPFNFCETYGEGDWAIVGILNPAPLIPCPQIFTPYFNLPVSCPELSLSGGGIVCEGNCPDDPNEIIFFVTGNDLPFEADLEVTASIFPPFAINDLEIFNGQELFVCLGGIFPSFDPGTNTLTIPSFAIGLTATVTVVSVTSASGCPVDMNSNAISLTFIPAASANAGPDQTICSYEQAMLNGNLSGSAVDASWSTSGDGIFGNPSLLSTTYTPGPNDIATGSVTLTLTGTDADNACIPAVSSLQLTIEPSITIDLGPDITICNTALADLSVSISDPSVMGVWETDGDGSFADVNDPTTTYEPGSDDLNSGSVQVYFNPVDPDICAESNQPLLISIVNAPIVNVPDNIEVCSEDSITIHINVFGNFTSITWSTSGDGVLMLITDTEVNYTPGLQDIADQFAIVSVTVVSAFPECGQTTYNLPIEIVLCGCSEFSTVPPSGPLCGTNSQIDLSTLLEAGGPGIWSITNTPPGSNPAMLSGNIFIANQSDAGVYTVTYTLDAPEPGCPASYSENITVTQEMIPEAGANIANCGPADVFVNGMVVPFGSAMTIWETLGDGSFVDPSSLSTSYIPGSLDSQATSIPIVLHLLDPVCGDKSDTTYILFPEPAFTAFIDDTVTVCNEIEKGSIFNFYSIITGGDNTGTWFNNTGVPVDFSNPSMVNFDGVAEGYYSFLYQTEAAMFPCFETTYTIIIKVEECDCPLLDIQSFPEAVCNDQPDLNLAAFVTAGAPGTWSIINVPAGSDPATLNGALLQLLNADPGTYRLRFTFDGAPLAGCIDSAEVSLVVQPVPTITIQGDTTSCGLLDISLSSVTGGSAVEVLWTTSGSGTFNDPALNAIVYSPSIFDLNSATATVYASGIDTSGACANAIDSVILLLVHPPMTSWSSLLTIICNEPDSGSVVNLSSFITGGDGTGIWTDADNSGVDLSNATTVDFQGVSPGTYVFHYLTQTAVPPCTDSLYMFTVVVEACACPSLLFNDLQDPLCIPSSLDLASLIIDAAPGTFTINGPSGNTPPVINLNTLQTNNADPGDYTLVYELIDSVAGCPASHSMLLSLEDSPEIITNTPVCDATTMMYSVEFNSNVDDLVVDVGMLSQVSPGSFLISNVPVGQDIIIVATSTSGECVQTLTIVSPQCTCTLFAEDISDTIYLCPGDTFVLIPFLTGAQGLAFFTWESADETLMRPTLPLFEANTWIWTVRDSAGCETRDTFAVAIKELITVTAYSISPSCDGLIEGSIVITDIDGGIGPYTIQVDNGPPFVSPNLPDTITPLANGLHALTVRNADGCESIIDINVSPLMEGQLDLGDDVRVKLGDSVLIEPILTDINYMDHIWDPSLINSSIDPFWFKPTANTIIRLLVTDSLGCVYEDDLSITVYEEENIFIPNVFSPNGDQANDIYIISSSADITGIQSIEIFDRWGNMLYRQTGPGPFAWDGTSVSSPVNPGVYVLKMVIRDQDNNLSTIVRDITLVR